MQQHSSSITTAVATMAAAVAMDLFRSPLTFIFIKGMRSDSIRLHYAAAATCTIITIVALTIVVVVVGCYCFCHAIKRA